jgi:dTDP-4-amino-4,6-dideoxygalactose transaminase
METIPHSRPAIGQEEIGAVTAVLQSGQLAQGEKVENFEKALAAQLGLGCAAAVASGTAALHLALSALEIGEGDEVAVPSFVCPALLNVIRCCRAVPLVADIDPATFNIDVDDLKRRLTRKTRAVVVPHLFGLPASIQEIVALGVPVIEDCAQALGSRVGGAFAGSFGTLSVFSFHATKVICTGEGGMVASGDRRLIERIRDLRDYDEKDDGRLRYNYKLTDLQAALGLVQLGRLPELLARRQTLAGRYGDRLRGCPGIRLPASVPGCRHIYYRYVIRAEQAAGLLAAGAEAGIAYRRPVFKPLHRYLGLKGYPETERALTDAVSLPLYPSLSDAEAERVLEHAVRLLQDQVAWGSR